MGPKVKPITKGDNQKSFTSNKQCMILWRRALLLRYYKTLGEIDNYLVQWNDVDTDKNALSLHDEARPFNGKPPHEKLKFTAVTVSKNNSKLFVVTLYHTTSKILVQGTKSIEWENEEYKPLHKIIHKMSELCSKGNNYDQVDKHLLEVPFASFLEVELNDSFDQTLQKELLLETQDDTLKSKQTDKKKTEQVQADEQKGGGDDRKKKGGDDKKKHEPKKDEMVKEKNEQRNGELCEMSERVKENTEEISKVKEVLHKIEQSQIEQEESIMKLNKTCESILEKVNHILDINPDIKKVNEVITKENKSLKSNLEAKIGEVTKNQKDQSKEADLRVQRATETLKPLIEGVSKQVKQLREQVTENEEKVESIDRKIEILQEQNADTKDLLNKVRSNRIVNEEGQNTHDIRKSNIDKSESDENSETSEEQIVPERNQDNQRERFSEEDSYGDDLWIIGSSIIKDLNGNKMFYGKKVRVTKLHDKTLRGALQFIRTKQVQLQPRCIKFQVGSNDLESLDAEEAITKLERLVEETRRIYPKSDIVVGETLPRFPSDRKLANQYEENRYRYNLLVKDFCNDNDVHFVSYSNLRMLDFIDGIHLNETGVRFYVSNMKKVINPILGVPNKESDQRSARMSRNRHFERSNIDTFQSGGLQRGYNFRGQSDRYSHFENQGQNEHRYRHFENQGQNDNQYRRPVNTGYGRENMLSLVEGLLREIRNN